MAIDNKYWDNLKGNIKFLDTELVFEYYHHADQFSFNRCPFCDGIEFIKKIYRIKDDNKTSCKHQTTVEDHSKYPHECPKCKGEAYVGLLTCECPKCGEFNLNY